jgi:hypothetical protein
LDATTSLAKFNDPTQWEHVDFNVPIFVEHELWEVPHPWDKKTKIKVAILPGQAKPKDGKLLYSIGPNELETAADEINEALQSTGNAVKVFIGHSDASKDQKANPKIIGYGVGAKMGTFGPKNHKAVIQDKVCYVKGHYEEAKTYPERSPEFQLLTGRITGLALLRTDPKLPMGMITYQLDDTVLYAAEFLKPKDAKEEQAGAEKGKEKVEGEAETQEAENLPDALPKDPTTPPTAVELPPEHKELAEKYMEHYKQHDPVMRSVCTKYEAECKAASAPQIPDNPEANPGTTPEKGAPQVIDEAKEPDKEVEKMAADALAINYQELTKTVTGLKSLVGTLTTKVDTLAQVNGNLTAKYAESESRRILAGLRGEGFVIKSAPKLLAKLAATDDAGRKAIVEDVRENYAQEVVQHDPTRGEMIGVSDDPAESEANDPAISEEDSTAATHYAIEHKIDISTDEGYAQVAKALAAQKNGRPQRRAA